jgi:hypothetical protein
VAGWIRSIEKSSDLIGNRTRDLLVCGIDLPRASLRCVVEILRASQVNPKKKRSHTFTIKKHAGVLTKSYDSLEWCSSVYLILLTTWC